MVSPYRIEMRVRFPPTAAAWGGGWMMNVDRNTTQEIFELDFAEQRTSFPTESLWHQHTVQNGQDVNQWHSSAVTVSDIRQNFHVWSADVYPDRVRYAVDGIPAPEIAYGATGRHGLVVNIGIGAPGTWGSGWTAPDPADPGPWDLLVDYVRVTPLP